MDKDNKTRNQFMLHNALSRKGYDWWWHNFTAEHEKTGEQKAFYIEYFLCNPEYAQEKPVIVWHSKEMQEKGIKPSYAMMNAGCWGKEKAQLHNFYPWKDVKINEDDTLNIEIGGNTLSETHIKGSIDISRQESQDHIEYMSDYGSISWDLKVNKITSYNVGYGASKIFRLLNAFEMFWHAEGIKTEYDGYVIYNGEKYIVTPEKSYGYADKNWGSDFTSPWIWLSSNNLVSEITGKKLTNSVFEIGGGTPKVFHIPLKEKLLGTFYYEGKHYEFNFSKFWTGSKTKFNCYETDDEIVWNIELSTFKAKIEVDIKCKKDEMLLINYESPDGYKRHNKLFNGGTGYGSISLYEKQKGKYKLIDKAKVENCGCEYGRY